MSIKPLYLFAYTVNPWKNQRHREKIPVSSENEGLQMISALRSKEF